MFVCFAFGANNTWQLRKEDEGSENENGRAKASMNNVISQTGVLLRTETS